MIKNKELNIPERPEIIPVTFDPVFKGVFQDKKGKRVLSYLIGEILDIDYDYVYDNLKFKNTELPKTNYQEKTKVTDLLVDIENMVINLEMNKNFGKGTLQKSNAYHHKIASELMHRGESYDDNKVAIQINFNAKGILGDKLVIKFMMRDDSGRLCIDENYINYHINMALIPKMNYNIDKVKDLSKFEKILAMMLSKNKERLRMLSKGDEMLMEFKDKIEELSDNQEIIGLYDKAARDEFETRLNHEEELNKVKIEIAKNMLKKQMDIKDIAEITGLLEEEIQALKH